MFPTSGILSNPTYPYLRLKLHRENAFFLPVHPEPVIDNLSTYPIHVTICQFFF